MPYFFLYISTINVKTLFLRRFLTPLNSENLIFLSLLLYISTINVKSTNLYKVVKIIRKQLFNCPFLN
jgi:hypothetical protein